MNNELYKIANAQTSLIIEALLGNKDKEGRVYNKIALTMVLRDQSNKATKTLRYYLDVPVAKVLFHDIWNGDLREEYQEFKSGTTTERGLKITLLEKGYRISIINKDLTLDKKDWLYFNLSSREARQIAITILDHLNAHELALAVTRLLGNKQNV